MYKTIKRKWTRCWKSTFTKCSYGAINYNTETYDYVRIGIIMYGVNSDNTAYQKN